MTIRAKDSAKRLKADLKAAFPATEFSVTVRPRSNTCTVRWTDGPTVALVDEIADRYQGKGFDGMTDSTYYIDAVQSDGKPSALGYVFTSRHLSDRFVERILEAVAAYWGGVETIPTVDDYKQGKCWHKIRPDLSLAWNEAVHRAASDRQTVTR